jgi:sugar porter (SP) family MFS transporter
MHRKFRFTYYSIFASLIAALGGFLFGYNTSVIAGALVFITKDFQLTTFQEELVVSTVLIGCVIGAFAGGFFADLIGRKKTLFLNLILFFIGIYTLTEASGFHSLMTGRLITGVAIGIASLAVPLYIAEIAPAETRGAFVSLNQLLITIGILIAYFVSYMYAEKQDWRDMFAFGFIPLIIQFIGLFFIPESPSWLISRGRRVQAEKVLHRLHTAHPNLHLKEIKKEEEIASKTSWRELFKPSVRKPFLVGIGISVFQQITGINTVIYYAPKIFQLAGYQAAQTAIFATMLVGIVNVLFTILALWLIDRIGRRHLLMWGLVGMGASLAVLGISFIGGAQNIGMTAVGGLMIYVAFFAVSLGPVAWLIITEIYPLGIRGRAMGVATLANWVCNYIVSLTFLSLIDTFGTGYTFWLYTIICGLGLWFVYKMVPETKGKTFEEIQHFWRK